MNTYDFVHLVLYAQENSKIEGKTKLQKIVYFFGIISKQIEDLGFKAHYYGPYSGEVSAAMSHLQALGFVQHSIDAWGHDNKGFEISRTDYWLTDDGKNIARKKAKQYPEIWKRLLEGVKVLKGAGDLGYMKLSIAAKTYFILKGQEKSLTTIDIANTASTLGWEVEQGEVEEAAKFLGKLKLVKEVLKS